MKYKNKTKTKKHLIGGIKQKDPKLTSWQAVYKMICTRRATLTAISYGSVEGFIFKLDIPHEEEHAEFYGLNDNGTAFNNPIYSLIFKFAIIYQTDGDKLDRPFTVTINKKTIETSKKMPTLQAFMNEAKSQQDIYIATISPVGRPITIGVVDFSYFRADMCKLLFTNLLWISPVNGNGIEISMLQYLRNHVYGDRMLGLITMDLVNSDFIKLHEVEHMKKNDINIINSDYNYVIAQILILFTKVKIINTDCHTGNILASKNSPSSNPYEIRSILIDFGRILNLFDTKYQNTRYERKIRNIYNSFYTSGDHYQNDKDHLGQLNSTHLYSNDKDKQTNNITNNMDIINNMHRIIKFIAFIDYAAKIIKNPETRFPQIIGILKYLYGTDDDDKGFHLYNFHNEWQFQIKNLNNFSTAKYNEIIPIFSKLTQCDGTECWDLVRNDAIEDHINNNEIFNIDSNANIHQFNQSKTTWTPLPMTIETGIRKRNKIKSDNTNCDNANCDPNDIENKDDCCQRMTRKFYEWWGFNGGKTKHKNKRSKKNNKTRKNNKRT